VLHLWILVVTYAKSVIALLPVHAVYGLYPQVLQRLNFKSGALAAMAHLALPLPAATSTLEAAMGSTHTRV
jgi:hypothetical protein